MYGYVRIFLAGLRRGYQWLCRGYKGRMGNEMETTIEGRGRFGLKAYIGDNGKLASHKESLLMDN